MIGEFERIGNVLEENQTEDNVLVFGGIHVVAQLIGGPHSFSSKPSGPPLFLDEGRLVLGMM